MDLPRAAQIKPNSTHDDVGVAFLGDFLPEAGRLIGSFKAFLREKSAVRAFVLVCGLVWSMGFISFVLLFGVLLMAGLGQGFV